VEVTVISSVTLSAEIKPFHDARWLKPGVFATITDVMVPWVLESMSMFDRIIIDDLVQESQMVKPLVEQDLVAGDLRGLLDGDGLGRNTVEERLAFVFRGLALGDLALAGLAYQRILA
jgi:ornithine cyclodeaminase/alanine dehydrogenase